MELIDKLKEAYFDGARYSYFWLRIEMASSRFLRTLYLYPITQNYHWDVKTRLEDRANSLEAKYRNSNPAYKVSYWLGKDQIKYRSGFKRLEKQARKLANKGPYLFRRGLRVIK